MPKKARWDYSAGKVIVVTVVAGVVATVLAQIIMKWTHIVQLQQQQYRLWQAQQAQN